MQIYKELKRIQQEIKAPKNQYNKFGNFKYRSLEDITEAFKKLDTEAVLLMHDEVVQVGDRYYIKATAKLVLGDEEVSVSAYAREAEGKTKMDDAQLTGACSSYARKYALNALFALDDTKDPDTDEYVATKAKKDTKKDTKKDAKDTKDTKKDEERIAKATTKEELRKLYEEINDPELRAKIVEKAKTLQVTE